MSFIDLCLRRPVSVSVGVLLVLLFGVLAAVSIPIQLTPNVDTPVITVETTWRGANPQEIEQEITDRQEEMLRSVAGLREMTSESINNKATVKLEFYAGVDKDAALRDVNDKLRQVSGYPLEVDQPTVKAADASIDNPIAWLILYPTEPGYNVREQRDFAEDHIKPYLDRVPGVASTDIYGGMQRELQVRVDAGELAARGLTLVQVRDALRGQNLNVSAGTRAQGKRDYTVRTIGQYQSPEEVLATVVAYSAGGPIYVRDVAEVELTYAKPVSLVRSKGEAVMAFPVRREVGANVMEVMGHLREAIRRVNSEVLEPRKVPMRLDQTYDETIYINHAISMVRMNIVVGGSLAIMILLLFLRNWRATLVVALAIPIAVIGTFVMMFAFGRTVNVVSLAGMAFAVGMVVDNAVVVLENIYRHRLMGKSAFAAAHDGTREVWGAVLAGTLTTMAVFLPVIFIQEEAGQLFRDISVATAVAVGLSLIVSVTVIPTVSARLFGSAARGAALGGQDEGASRYAHFVAGLVERINGSLFARLAIVIVMVGGAVVLTPRLVPDTTYLPAGNRNLIFGFLLTPPGYNMDEFVRMADRIEEVVSPYWKVAPGSPEHQALDDAWRAEVRASIENGSIAELNDPDLGWLERSRIMREWLSPPPLIANFFYVSFDGGCFMGAISADEARVKPLKRLLEKAGGTIPGAIPIFFQTQIFSFGGGNNALIQIRGDNLDEVTTAATAVFMASQQEFGFPRPSPSNFNLGRPELQIFPNRERAADLGLDTREIGLFVEACVDGSYVGDYRLAGGSTIDLILYVKDQRDRPMEEIAQAPLFTPAGRVVPLAAVADLLETTAAEQINHVERQRAVTLEVTPPETMALEAVIRSIRNDIEKPLRDSNQIPPGVLIGLAGNADKLTEARNTMVGEWQGWTLKSLMNIVESRFFLSVLVVYLLMAALFESWLYPFVIMFSVPLAVFGGFLGLWLAHKGTMLTTDQPIQQLDVITFLGFVILVGLVVNNAILLVHQSLVYIREENRPVQRAIVDAVRVRVRPVLMTSLTTIIGQAPLAFFPGAGSELYRGLASVMLGGLAVSAACTLLLVPAVLSLVMAARTSFQRALAGGSAAAPVTRDP